MREITYNKQYFIFVQMSAMVNLTHKKDAINVNVNTNIKNEVSRDIEQVTYPDDAVVVVKSSDDYKQLENKVHVLEHIIKILQDNPIKYNGYVIADDELLICLVQDLCDADSVQLDADDIDCSCITSKSFRKVHAIYVVKDGVTKNLKYDYPDITKYLLDLKISTKFVF
jgi:hypothetical protein